MTVVDQEELDLDPDVAWVFYFLIVFYNVHHKSQANGIIDAERGFAWMVTIKGLTMLDDPSVLYKVSLDTLTILESLPLPTRGKY